jgi:hypothetical protein
VWQLVGVEKIQNGSRCHRNQGEKMLNSLPTSQSFAILRCFMKFDEKSFFFLNSLFFLFPWQLRQSLSNRFRISFIKLHETS